MSSQATTPFVKITAISKTFGGVHALDNVSMDIAAGEVHALVGENGAGKSTLIKILSGYHTQDSGSVSISGSNLHTGDVAASEAAGIAVIHQESTAFPHLSVEDNIFVGREPRIMGLFLDRKLMRRRTLELLNSLGEVFEPKRIVGELSVAQQQIVAVARAISKNSRLLIMDEPTASLSARETEVLFRIIRQLKSDGVSILYVSHRMDEIFELADRVTVLRDGKLVGTYPIADVTRDSLIQAMVGRELDADMGETREAKPGGDVLLDIKNLSNEDAFQNISFSVKAGEIVALAGLVGAGRSEVARATFGADRPTAGEVRVAEKALKPGSIQAAMEAGVALVPEDRQHQGLVLPLPVATNLTMVVRTALSKFGLISPSKESSTSKRLITDLNVKAESGAIPAESLSGGNQQKLVIGKWLAFPPRILIMDEPTRGIDVGAKAEIHKLIRKLADSGTAVLFISSDLPEVLSMSDRIIVMRSGQIAGELTRAEATQEAVLDLALVPGRSEAEPVKGGVS